MGCKYLHVLEVKIFELQSNSNEVIFDLRHFWHLYHAKFKGCGAQPKSLKPHIFTYFSLRGKQLWEDFPPK